MRKIAALYSLPVLAAIALVAAQQDPLQEGPSALLIQYRCTPAERGAFRQAMESSGVRAFEGWKTNGILVDYHLLFSRYTDSNNWDMLAILQFRDYASVVKWNGVERRTPAGLDSGVMAHVYSVSSYPVDPVRVLMPDSAIEHPVYLVTPYAVSGSVPQFVQYLDQTVVPQLGRLANGGPLAGYWIFCQRYMAARPWDSLVVLEYKDHESSAQAKPLDERQGPLGASREAVIADEIRPTR